MQGQDPYKALPTFDALSVDVQARLRALASMLAEDPTAPTAVRSPDEVAQRHIGDSLTGLSVAEIRDADRVADLGSGAGLPGLVLALTLPAARVDLVESSRKKCEFIQRAAEQLELENVSVIQDRAELWAAASGSGVYDVVTARALASLPVLVEYAAPLLLDNGALVAWKGAVEESEWAQGLVAADRLGMGHDRTVNVSPYAASRDHRLYVFRKLRDTPTGFPRRSGMAVKRPLGSE